MFSTLPFFCFYHCLFNPSVLPYSCFSQVIRLLPFQMLLLQPYVYLCYYSYSVSKWHCHILYSCFSVFFQNVLKVVCLGLIRCLIICIGLICFPASLSPFGPSERKKKIIARFDLKWTVLKWVWIKETELWIWGEGRTVIQIWLCSDSSVNCQINIIAEFSELSN